LFSTSFLSSTLSYYPSHFVLICPIISNMTPHLHMIPILQAPIHVGLPFPNTTYFCLPSRFPCYRVVPSNSN
jgi:hypothetical protein